MRINYGVSLAPWHLHSSRKVGQKYTEQVEPDLWVIIHIYFRFFSILLWFYFVFALLLLESDLFPGIATTREEFPIETTTCFEKILDMLDEQGNLSDVESWNAWFTN